MIMAYQYALGEDLPRPTAQDLVDSMPTARVDSPTGTVGTPNAGLDQPCACIMAPCNCNSAGMIPIAMPDAILWKPFAVAGAALVGIAWLLGR